jgi:RND family efflux transporter MFP subunit
MIFPRLSYRWFLPAIFLLSSALSASSKAWTSRGIVEPYQDAKVSATVSGTVVAINAKEGQFVHAGEVVIELDSALEALEVERRKLVWESKAELDAATSRMETLRLDLEGTRKLQEETKSVSLDDLRKKELEFRLAEGEHERLRVSEEREDIEYRFAQAQLQKKFIAAPFDGIIVQKLLEVGEGCSQQQALFRIVDTRKCRLVVHMEQAPSLKMKPGRQVTLRIQEADGPVTVQGTVEFVSPLVDASSGLREVKLLFDNPDGRVHPGVTGAVGAER